MKTLLVLSILFCVIPLPVFGELTDADLDKMRLIVKEEVKTETTAVRQELKAEIASSEKNLKEYINVKIESVEKRLSTRVTAHGVCRSLRETDNPDVPSLRVTAHGVCLLLSSITIITVSI